MAKPIEQMTIEGKVEKQYVATYKTIIKNKPQTLYEATMAVNELDARVKITERLKGKGLAFQITKVEEFISD